MCKITEPPTVVGILQLRELSSGKDYDLPMATWLGRVEQDFVP